MSRSRRLALALAVTAWGAFLLTVLVVTLGPLALPAIGLSISHPSRLALVAGLAGGAALLVSGRRGPLLTDISTSPAAYVATFMLVVLLTLAALLTRGAVSIGGADSAGYLAQARRWQHGVLQVPLPLAIPGLADQAWPQSALGFRPDPSGRMTVPIYPPGLPWLQALALTMGGEPWAIRGVPAVTALLALLALFLLAARHTDVAGAALVIVCLASTPVFLLQALQPMSDVPALALWLLALTMTARRGAGSLAIAGAAVALAVLVRPNLAPLAVPVGWQAMLGGRTRHEAARRIALVVVAVMLPLGIVASIQATLYGSPTQSGYGGASELFSIAHVPPNLRLYSGWLLASLSLPGLAIVTVGAASAAVASLGRCASLRPPMLMALITIALYLVYVPFDSWTYLRFVLIPLALAPLGVAVLLAARWRARPGAWRFPVFAALVLAVAAPNLQRAQELGVFAVRDREYRYQAAGAFVRDALPADTVVVAAQHSGSAAYYAERAVLRADLLDARGFEAVRTWSEQTGRPLAFVLDTSELDDVRARLGATGLTGFDWPPRAEIGRPVTTRVWVSTDRARYLAGQPVPVRRLLTAARSH